MSIRVVTDSTADLSPALVERYRITVVPTIVMFEDEALRDGVDITPEQFFMRLERSSTLPTTAQPSAGAFQEAYQRLVDEGATEIFSIHLSSKLSGTLESARQGAARVEGARIITLDSQFASAALGLAAIRAAAAVEQHATLEQTQALVADQLARTHCFFLLDTLEYLRRGGRVGRASELLGSLLRIKPLLEVRDGEVVAAGRARTRRRAIEELLRRAAELRPIEQAMAFHATTPDDLEYFVTRLKGYAVHAPVGSGTLGPTVGVHTGPGTLGFALVTAKETSP